MTLISLNKVSVSYENLKALNNVSFDIESGDYICIVGENGSGKSTLVKSILGLVPVKSGEIEYKALNKNEIGYLPQQSASQKDFPASVYEVVLSGCLNKCGLLPFYSKAQKQLAEDNIELLGMTAQRNKSFMELSGGQQQRVLLARALCASSKMLVLDEPVTGLDPLVTMEFYELIRKIVKEKGITVLMVSHDIETAVRHADKILHIDNTVLFYGGRTEYINSQVGKKFVGGII